MRLRGFRVVVATLYISFTCIPDYRDSRNTQDTLYGLYCWNRDGVISVKYLPTARLPFDVYKIGTADSDSMLSITFRQQFNDYIM